MARAVIVPCTKYAVTYTCSRFKSPIVYGLSQVTGSLKQSALQAEQAN